MSRLRAGRPTGWSPKTGWDGRGLGDQKATQRREQVERFEAFCCAQVERVEIALAARYSRELHESDWDRTVPDNRYMAMPSNDYMTRQTLLRDGEVLWRGNGTHMSGANKGGAW